MPVHQHVLHCQNFFNQVTPMRRLIQAIGICHTNCDVAILLCGKKDHRDSKYLVDYGIIVCLDKMTLAQLLLVGEDMKRFAW